ncbi:MAG TPA: prolyl oligopeptidase family serine peptidase [Candidatus Limnocylindrales bacterium]|nr:prolyl oligopeptidase family serine peptidase [Candidatus Limnocylindrales bacterium]
MFRPARIVGVFAALLVMACAGGAGAQAPASKSRLTIEQLIEIKHPSDPVWSPDGKHVAFIWDRADIRNLYVADADGHGAPVQLTSFPEGEVNSFFWSAAGDAIYFPHEGGLWQVSVTGGTPGPVWGKAEHGGGFALSPDGKRVAFVRGSHFEGEGSEGNAQGSDLLIRGVSDGNESVVAHDDVSLGNIRWSPDGNSLLYIGGAKIIHHDESPAYSGAKLIYRVSEFVPGQIYAIKLDGGKPVAIAKPDQYGGLAWIDSDRVVFDGESKDFKKYFIYTAAAATGSVKVIHEIDEEKFWSIPDWGEAGAQPWPSPNGKWIAFLSDQDGWDHLYVMPSDGGDAVQITKGKFEAWRPAWSHDSTRIAFDANLEDHPGDRRLGVAKIGDDPAHATVAYITAGKGTNIEPHWSSSDAQLVYQHTDTRNSADLFAIDASGGGKPARLTESMPAGIDHSQFVEPQFVHYPGPDGKLVPGWLFVPKNLDKTKKHPAILWIHGDGVNQNYDGWHVQRNYAVYYSIHQYFLQKGYVVFAPDYRGSIGYGRDWRTGVYMDVGGKDAKDAWMGANYLKSLPYVDGDRIGVWGLSYGGFFTLIAMTDQPTLFRCGVDVAGVVDYVMYYNDPYHGDWTASRIGTPEENPQVYANASPVSHIDRLARPLLVLHGTADVNVPFLESIRLIDEALKNRKGDLLSFMVYPGEFHYFSREHVLRDAWHRVDDFFDLHLRGVPADSATQK